MKNTFFSILLLLGLLMLTVEQKALCEELTQDVAPLAQADSLQPLTTVATELSPAWQRRYFELKSMSEDVATLTQQLPPVLDDVKDILLNVQQHATFILLDLVPAKNDVHESSQLARALMEWQWYMEIPLKNLDFFSGALAIYIHILSDMEPAFRRGFMISHHSKDIENTVLDIKQLYALLSTDVAQLQAAMRPVYVPAQQLLDSIQRAVKDTEQLLPSLWMEYYTTPVRLSRLNMLTAGEELQNIGKTLLRSEILYRQVGMAVLVDIFIICIFYMFFRVVSRLQKLPSNIKPSLPHMLCTALNSLNIQQKSSLVVIAICSTNILIDTLPFVHIHIPYMVVQNLALLLAVVLWVRSRSDDPHISLLFLPVAVGQLLLHGDASALWMIGIFGAALLLSIACMLLCPLEKRSFFYNIWLGLLMLSTVIVIMGFGRIVVLLLLLVLFMKAGDSVLRKVYRSRTLRLHPLGLPLLMPLLTFLLFTVAIIGTMSCPGIPSLLGHWQQNDLRIFNLHLQLRDIVLVLAIFFGLLAFIKVSRQFLLTISRGSSVLDSSAVPVIHSVLNCSLWVLFTLFTLGILGVDVRSLAFIGGALTVGIGFGLQSIISNFFSGLVLIFANVVRGGDLIEIGAIKGWVRSINMRATIVETIDNSVYFIPNVEMLNSRIANWTKNNHFVRESVPVSVTPESDVNLVRDTLMQVVAGHPGTLPEPPPKVFLSNFGTSSLDFTIQVWVAEVSAKNDTLSSLRCAVYEAFAQKGIALSSPRLDIMMKHPMEEIDIKLDYRS